MFQKIRPLNFGYVLIVWCSRPGITFESFMPAELVPEFISKLMEAKK